MRLVAAIAFAGLGMLSSVTGAPLPASAMNSNLIQVQMRCTPNSCINERTGVYTQSHCDRYGCRPIGGPVGQLGPDGEDEGRVYQQHNSYGRFTCNPNRCIDRSNGEVWESHCDSRGCRPIQPSANQY